MGVAVEGFGKNLEEDTCAAKWNTYHSPPPTSTVPPISTSRSSHQHLPFLPFGICDHMIGAVEMPENMKMGTGETTSCRLQAGCRFPTALRLFSDENNHEAVRFGQEQCVLEGNQIEI